MEKKMKELDLIINRFLVLVSNSRKLQIEDVNGFLEQCSEVLQVDAMYLLELCPDGKSVSVRYSFFRNEYSALLDNLAKAQNVQSALQLFEKQDMYSYIAVQDGREVSVLCYGIFDEEDFQGTFVMTDCSNPNRIWQKEEKEKLAQIGNILRYPLLRSRLKQIDSVREKQIQDLKRYERLVNTAISDAYIGACKINLDTQECYWLRFENNTIEELPFSGGWMKMAESFMQNVHPEDADIISEFCGPKLLELGPGELLTFHYRSAVARGDMSQDRYCWYTTKVRTFQEGENRFASIFSIDDTEAIEQELDQKDNFSQAIRDLSEANTILDTISSHTYSSVYLIELGNGMTSNLSNLTNQRKRRSSIKRTWDELLDQMLAIMDDVDRNRVYETLCLDSLKEKSDEDEIEAFHFSSDINADGIPLPKKHWYTMRVHILKGRDQAVMFTIDDTRVVEREEQQQELLSDALLRAETANRAKSDFLSNMSHDIRTPMNAIIGFTSLAIAHIDNINKVEDCLNKINSSSNHLLSLINDVLDMSRIESGNMTLNEKPCGLSDIAHDLKGMIQGEMLKKQLDMHIDIVDVENEDIVVDRLRLNQILLNLLSNSMKFTGNGGKIWLKILERKDAPQGYATYEFHVKDTGVGMSPEFVEHIFEPFSRERNTTASGVMGTGLGMSITKNIVDMMGGTISVESELGIGTEFTVILTVKLQEGIKKQEPIEELCGKRMLVIDDNACTGANIVNMLICMGVRAEWTTDSDEALKRVEANTYSGFVVDWTTQEECLSMIQELRKMTGNETKIIVTGYDLADISEKVKAYGANGLCSKPVFMSTLRFALLNVFGIQRETIVSPTGNITPKYFVGKRLLLVEDNELNAEIATDILQDAGFEVEQACDGSIAVDKVMQSRPGYYDLVLMDIQMPIMNGYDATRMIRSLRNEEQAKVPIIAMTANAFEEDRRKALDCGMNGHIAKPVELDKLFETLKEIIC